MYMCVGPSRKLVVDLTDGFARLFEIYFASFAQWVAALSPNSASASILFSCFFSFVIIVRALSFVVVFLAKVSSQFNGVVQPVTQLPYVSLFPLSLSLCSLLSSSGARGCIA